VVTVDEYGNNSTASIPLALAHALDEGRIRDGDRLLLVAFGGGLSWAAGVLTWGGGRYPARAGARDASDDAAGRAGTAGAGTGSEGSS